jgi:nitroimidazol reductase NimA-like FMN-containing flavoprotein (pyridoxamine 5'-phosphate oxidase superfamily)
MAHRANMRRCGREEAFVEDKAIGILDTHRTMAIATVRPDGWPQNTVVGYANDGLLIYFLISRASQKFANIEADERVSIAVAKEPDDIHQLKAVYAGALASEVTDPSQREQGWKLLVERHPNLTDYVLPDRSQAAMMRAFCKYVSILDFSEGLGHADEITIGASGIAAMEAARTDDWGLSGLQPKQAGDKCAPTEPGE